MDAPTFTHPGHVIRLQPYIRTVTRSQESSQTSTSITVESSQTPASSTVDPTAMTSSAASPTGTGIATTEQPSNPVSNSAGFRSAIVTSSTTPTNPTNPTPTTNGSDPVKIRRPRIKIINKGLTSGPVPSTTKGLAAIANSRGTVQPRRLRIRLVTRSRSKISKSYYSCSRTASASRSSGDGSDSYIGSSSNSAGIGPAPATTAATIPGFPWLLRRSFRRLEVTKVDGHSIITIRSKFPQYLFRPRYRMRVARVNGELAGVKVSIHEGEFAPQPAQDWHIFQWSVDVAKAMGEKPAPIHGLAD